MKSIKLFVLIISILGSINVVAQNNLVRDFIVAEMGVKTQKYTPVFIVEEKIPNKETIRTLQGLGILRNDGTIVYSGTKKIPQKDFKTMMEKFGNYSSIKKWTIADFKHLNVTLISDADDGISKFFKSKLSTGERPVVYAASEVIYFKDFAFFFIAKSSKSNSGYPSYAQVILMQKKKKKWVEVERIASTDLH